MVFAIALLACSAECQSFFKPVDISGFGEGHAIQAVAEGVSISACNSATYFQNGTWHSDGMFYDVHISANLRFKNGSAEAAILYKDFFALTVRVAASPQDITSGKFVGGSDGDRMAIDSEPKHVSIDDFAVIAPGESYTGSISGLVAASRDSKSSLLHTPGRYWVQLGIDARPDEFYYTGGKEKAFKHQWRSRGQLVDFILAEPFPIDITLDPNAPLCKY